MFILVLFSGVVKLKSFVKMKLVGLVVHNDLCDYRERGRHFHVGDFEEMGRHFCEVLLDYSEAKNGNR